MTGIRRDQSETRGQLNFVEWDTANGLLKFNPLLKWSEADVWAYIKEHKVPYSALIKATVASVAHPAVAQCRKVATFVMAAGGGRILNIKSVDYIEEGRD